MKGNTKEGEKHPQEGVLIIYGVLVQEVKVINQKGNGASTPARLYTRLKINIANARTFIPQLRISDWCERKGKESAKGY